MDIGARVLEFGFIILVGIVSGKSLCGKVCPVGLIQGLLYKIPFPRKIKTFKAHKYLRYLKYIILFIAIVLFFIFPVTEPAGNTWPMNGTMKWGLTFLLLVVCMMTYRPFCSYLCPYEAFLSVGNLVPLYRYRVDRQKCNRCGICGKACKMNLKPYEQQNHMDCNHCGACKKACPTKAISSGFVSKAKNTVR